jgi:hypothetical protein
MENFKTADFALDVFRLEKSSGISSGRVFNILIFFSNALYWRERRIIDPVSLPESFLSR